MHEVDKIGSELVRIAKELSKETLEFDVSYIQNPLQGDISSNIALIHYKKLGFESPRDAAEKIVELYKQMNDPCLERIEIAGPGFINFYLSTKQLLEVLNSIVQNGEEFEKLDTLNSQKRKVIVEFGDPNPFKEIHIGHLRNFCIGESFSKLLETQGNEVIRANYQGDVGMHVAKALYGVIKKELNILDENLSLEDKSKMLAQAYAYGANEFEKSDLAKQEITDLNKKVYMEDAEVKSLWEEGRKISLDHFETLYKRIGVHYDKYYFESETAKRGKELVLSHIEDGIFEKHDGAVVYRGEQEGLHTRVFLTSQDYATYEGKDLALAVIKNEDVSYDESVILTGNEQLEYFAVMLAALKKIVPDLAQKTHHLTFGHVRLKEGKMSSRTGDVITASWLLDEAVNKVQESFPEMDSDTAEKVGVGAVKYSMLKFSIPSDIHFDFSESVSIEGNSGPYLQYTHVRTQSVLSKAGDGNIESEVSADNLENEESELLRFLSQYSYHVGIAATTFAPNLLCNYLFELSQKYNLFYQKCRVIGSENEKFRLKLTKSVGIVLRNGLTILGIQTVEKM